MRAAFRVPERHPRIPWCHARRPALADLHGAPAAVRLLAVLACAVIPWMASPGFANPVPSLLIFTHVHDDGEGFCSTPPAICGEIVQLTDRQGTLAFDLIACGELEFLYEIPSIQFTIGYPEDWAFVRGRPAVPE